MNTDPIELLMARLLSSPLEVETFLGDRETYARKLGLTCGQIAEAFKIDGASLKFAAKSFDRKRMIRD